MEIIWAVYGIGFVAVALVLIYLAKELFDLSTPYKLKVQLSEKDNAAVGIVLCGYLLGVTAVICGVYAGDGESEVELTPYGFLLELGPIALYGFLGMVLLLLSGLINDKLILRYFSNFKEVVENKNMGVALVVGAGFLGSGLIVAGGIRGSLSLLSALVAYALGQFFMVLFALIYQKVTSYDDQKELCENRNVGVGIAFGGSILAYCLLLMKGLTMEGGELVMMADRVWHFGYYAVAGAVLLPILRLVNDRFFLTGVQLADEIVKDKNLNAGLLEAGLSLAMAAVLIVAM